MHARILVVDDDESARAALEKLLHADGFVTSTAPDGEAALAEARRVLPDLVLTDLHMPRMNGVELCERVHEIDRDIPVIVMTALADMASTIDSLRAGAEDYLIKPLQYEAVLWCVERAIARRTAKREQEEIDRALNERLVLSSIREREHAEAEAKQRAQLNALLGNLSEGVVIADASGRVLMINDAARATLGVGDQDVPYAHTLHSQETLDLEGRPLHDEQRPLHRALRGEQFVDYEVLQTRPNGERRRIISMGTSVSEANGTLALAIVVFRDVTELRRLEQHREEYLALISHDLRNPLSTILMSSALLMRSLEEKGLTGERILAERSARNGKRMSAMIEELTEATTLESQGVTSRRGACDLRGVVAGVLERMDDVSARRIAIEVDGAAQYSVLADVSRIDRVIANLLTNALKYSAEDTPVTVRLARKGPDVELEVSDRGIGIAPESIKMLFERYYRTKAGQERASGLGLGLYITRMIVEAHGGRVDLSSEVGKGSTFRISLPSSRA